MEHFIWVRLAMRLNPVPCPNGPISGMFCLWGLTLPADIPPARLRDRRELLAAIDETRGGSVTAPRGCQVSMTISCKPSICWWASAASAHWISTESQPTSASCTATAPWDKERCWRGGWSKRESPMCWSTIQRTIRGTRIAKNFDRLKNTLLPPADQAAAALLADLEQRGMLDDVLVLMTGEMGRTPKINKNSGRDHWPDVFSLLIAGGGLTRCQVLGRSSRHADTPETRPVHFNEILATVYHQLGIDPNLTIKDRQDRPVRILPAAEPVQELIRG